MDKLNKLFLDPSEHVWPTSEINPACANSKVRITDERVARLLLLLCELDESVAELEELPPKPELSELISSAILACGFVDPIEERYAIAAVLEAIEVNGSMPESS